MELELESHESRNRFTINNRDFQINLILISAICIPIFYLYPYYRRTFNPTKGLRHLHIAFISIKIVHSTFFTDS